MRTLRVAVLSVVLLGALAKPALAHPFGTPPTAAVYSSDRSVAIEWEAAADDAIALGVHIGVLDVDTNASSTDSSSDVELSAADAALLNDSVELRDYLLEHIKVLQDGERCPATVQPVSDFLGTGATVVHECRSEVDRVDIEITMLQDIHEAYRTFAAGVADTDANQAVFTVAAPRHPWDFASASAAPAWSIHPSIVVALGVGVAGLAVYRRRRARSRVGRGQQGRPEEGRSRHALRHGTSGLLPIGLLLAVEPERYDWLGAEFVRLMDRPGAGPVFAVTALVVAFGIGALHALAPGHGKALIGAYLVGTRGRMRDALGLGIVVAAMHSASVLVLGGVFATASTRTDVGALLPWMSVLAGALITAVGGGLVIRQVRGRTVRATIAAGHAGSPPDHGTHAHTHPHAHGHHHLPEGVSPLSWRGIVALGVSGGLLPSPSAFIVFATGVLVGRVLFGLLLVAAFSIGLATTLTVFGLAAIRGRALVERRTEGSPRLARLMTLVPIITSVAVLGAGLWITALAILRL